MDRLIGGLFLLLNWTRKNVEVKHKRIDIFVRIMYYIYEQL